MGKEAVLVTGDKDIMIQGEVEVPGRSGKFYPDLPILFPHSFSACGTAKVSCIPEYDIHYHQSTLENFH